MKSIAVPCKEIFVVLEKSLLKMQRMLLCGHHAKVL